MSKYLIHGCKDRKWYVENYLLPSMYDQGISDTDICVYMDMDGKGCLQSFMDSIEYLLEDGDTWHLQDDILLCSDFKKRTEQIYDTELVCGFASKYDKEAKPGVVKGIDNIWFSFPCIRIPNSILRHFSVWFYSYLRDDNRFKMWIRSKKNEDLLFRYFIDNYYKELTATNVAPNLVEHIDWLIGGSLVNKQRDEIVRSLYWTEEDVVEKLKNLL